MGGRSGARVAQGKRMEREGERETAVGMMV